MPVPFDVSQYNVIPSYDVRKYGEIQSAQKQNQIQSDISKAGISEGEYSFLQSKGIDIKQYEQLKNTGYSKEAILTLALERKEHADLSPSAIKIFNKIVAGDKVSFEPSDYISTPEGGVMARNYSHEKELNELRQVIPNLPYGKGVIVFEGGRVRTLAGASETEAGLQSGYKVEGGKSALEVSKEIGLQNVQDILSGKAESLKGTLISSGGSKDLFGSRFEQTPQELIDYATGLQGKGEYNVELKNGEYLFTETPASIAANQAKAVKSIVAQPGQEISAVLGSGVSVPFSKLTAEQQNQVREQYLLKPDYGKR
jgi:hypothetical protein